MILPEIINYILTLRYPESQTGRSDFICYLGFTQVRIPLIPAGREILYTVRPAGGVFAWLGYRRLIGTDMVPDVFSSSFFQYGTSPFSGLVTQTARDIEHPGFTFITEREPLVITVTNISPLAQKGEMIGYFVVITSESDLGVITDALRRLHTSARSEQLLQEADYLLGVLAGQNLEPRPPIGES